MGLAAARGFEPLIDRSEICAFEDWWRIQSLIAEADTTNFVLSPESVASPICAKEMTFGSPTVSTRTRVVLTD